MPVSLSITIAWQVAFACSTILSVIWWIAWVVLSFSRFPYFERRRLWIRRSLLVRLEIFALISLYLSLTSAIAAESSFRTRPDESDHVTFLSLTSMPIRPRHAMSTIFFETAIARCSYAVLSGSSKSGGSTYTHGCQA